jgi:putative salt-induced outer membrane protein YdiY
MAAGIVLRSVPASAAGVPDSPLGKETEVIWQREVSVGYNRTSGNTHTSELLAKARINRNRKHVDEITLKGEAFYSSTERKMNAQKWYGMGRYAMSFGGNKNWYWFGRGEADHDRFANIDYRLIPAAGIGYWLFDEPEIKAMAEVGLGLEHTEYRDETENADEWVLVPRAFFEKTLFGKSKITQDLYVYPLIEDINQYRVHSETVFTTPVSEHVSLHISVVDDYNASPAPNVKKNDIRVISSIGYVF